ncbi:MAG: hypothetical protein KC731_32805, partial [Myxococcales bacterium]|nr:hypothetical protein [Myxococcales bacterium]
MNATMNKRGFLSLMAVTALGAWALPAAAQSKRYDIDPASMPPEVRKVLEQYLAVLRKSADLDQCAERFVAVAGGSLVNEDGKTLRGSVKPYGLKKDYNNIKFYADPAVISRVAKLDPVTSGFGPSAIRGPRYKIWIDKKSGEAGRPAPVTILVPEGHKTIRAP